MRQPAAEASTSSNVSMTWRGRNDIAGMLEDGAGVQQGIGIEKVIFIRGRRPHGRPQFLTRLGVRRRARTVRRRPAILTYTAAPRPPSLRSGSQPTGRRSRCVAASWLPGARAPGPEGHLAVCRMGLEGIVSKRTDAPYRSGPSKVWLKSKNPATEAVRPEREEQWR